MTESINDGFFQTSINQRLLEGMFGTWVEEHERVNYARSYVNKDPQAKQSNTLTVTGTAATHTFTFDGVEYVVTTGSGTAAGDAALILAEMRSQGAIYGAVDLSIATATITLTAKQPGFTFSLTESDANLTTASVTSAADAAEIDFGRAVVKGGYSASGQYIVGDSQEAAQIADTSAFTAQLTRWDFATMSGSGDNPGVVIEVLDSGVPAFEVLVDWNTDEDTTLDDLATAVNAKLVDFGLDSYVTAAGPTGAPGAGQFQIVADIAGVEFKAVAFCDDASIVVTEDAATVAASASTSLRRAFAGIAMRKNEEASALNPSSSEIPANTQFLAAEKGDVWVENAETLSYLGQVYVDLTAGAGAGKLYGSAGSNRVPLPLDKAAWIKRGRVVDSQNIGWVRLS